MTAIMGVAGALFTGLLVRGVVQQRRRRATRRQGARQTAYGYESVSPPRSPVIRPKRFGASD